MILDGTRTTPLTQAEIDQLEVSIGNWGSGSGNFNIAQFYLDYYLMTGSRQVLIQSQINTYSGFIGGAALMGNAIAKMANGELYNVSLDQFSYQIAEKLFQTIKANFANGGGGILTAQQIQDADRSVWAEKGMQDYFPGNLQFGDRDLSVLLTSGTIAAGLTGYQFAFGNRVGYMPSDFPNANSIAIQPSQYDAFTQSGNIVVYRDPSTNKIIHIEENVGLTNQFTFGATNGIHYSIASLLEKMIHPNDPMPEPGIIANATASLAINNIVELGNKIGLMGGAIGNIASDGASKLFAQHLMNIAGDYSQSQNNALREHLSQYVGAAGRPVNTNLTLPQGSFGWDTAKVILASASEPGIGSGDGETFIAFANAMASGGGGSDILIASGAAIANGDAGDDVLVGRDAGTLLNGGDGSDVMLTALAATAEGGTGGDWMLAVNGGVARGQAGNDWMLAINIPALSNDGAEAHGGDDNDLILVGAKSSGYGDDGEDTVLGYNAAVMQGGANDDHMIHLADGGTFASISGGQGNDKLYGLNYANIDGGAGDDIIFLIGANETGKMALSSILGTDIISNALRSLASQGPGIPNIPVSEQPSDSISIVTGGLNNDRILAGSGRQDIDGGSGDDHIEGGAGADILKGGSEDATNGGFDTLSYSTSSTGITLDLETGSGSRGDADGDQVSGFENYLLSTHDDLLIGSGRSERIDGSTGSDTIMGAGGNDILIGGNNLLSTDIDTAVYRGRWIDYKVTVGDIPNSYVIQDKRNDAAADHEGTDAVSGFERFSFAQGGGEIILDGSSILNRAPTRIDLVTGEGDLQGEIAEGFYLSGTVLARFAWSDENQYDVVKSWGGSSYTVNLTSFVAMHMLADGTAEARLTRDTVFDYESWIATVNPNNAPMSWSNGRFGGEGGTSYTTPFNDKPYAFSISVTDWGDLSFNRSFNLNILDRAEDISFPDQTGDPDGDGDPNLTTFRVNEMTTAVGQVSIQSPYSISYRIKFGDDGSKFEIDAQTGAISFRSAPDFEAPSDWNGDNAYELTVVALTSGGNAAERKVKVIVENIQVDQNLMGWASGGTIAENSEGGSVVGRIKAGALPTTAGITYALASDSSGLFAIDQADGTIRLSSGSKPNYESAPFHDVIVSAQEGSETAVTKTVRITVSNVNEGSTRIDWMAPPAGSAFDGTPGSVKENAAAGRIVGVLKADDPDAGDVLTYSLVGTSSQFEIVGDQVRVKSGAVLDYETKTSWDLSIKVKDAAGIEFITTKTVAIENVSGLFTGTSASNSINGTVEEDTIYGLGGNDFLYGGGGNDAIYGGTENDFLSGGDGNDNLYGEAGDDTIEGGRGINYIDGGSGIDKLTYTALPTGAAFGINLDMNAGMVIIPNYGTDIFVNIESVNGSVNADTIIGNAGNNTIDGGYQNDILKGGAGSDYLYGNYGDDHLWGDGGNDYIYGGYNTDTVHFSGTWKDYTFSKSGTEWIGVSDKRGTDGFDWVYSDVENFHFSDVVKTRVNVIPTPPTFTVTAQSSVQENSAPGTVVATVTGIGPDTTVTLGNSTLDLLEYVNGSVRIKAGSNVDYETVKNLSFTLIGKNSRDDMKFDDKTVAVTNVVENKWDIGGKSIVIREDMPLKLSNIIDFQSETGSNQGSIKIQANEGADLTMSQSVSGVTVTTGQSEITLSGSASAVRSALSKVTLTPEVDSSDTISLAVSTINEQGLTDSETLSIGISPTADAIFFNTYGKNLAYRPDWIAPYWLDVGAPDAGVFKTRLTAFTTDDDGSESLSFFLENKGYGDNPNRIISFDNEYLTVELLDWLPNDPRTGWEGSQGSMWLPIHATATDSNGASLTQTLNVMIWF